MTDEKRRAYMRAYYAANKERILARRRGRYSAYYRERYLAKREEILAAEHLRYVNDPEFRERKKAVASGWRRANPDRARTPPEVTRAYRQDHPDRAKAYYKASNLRKYGLTLTGYRALAAAQGDLCAICGQPETQAINGIVSGLSVDHCHDTGRVRGLLCAKCNLALAHLRDDPVVARAAMEYLERHQSAER